VPTATGPQAPSAPWPFMAAEQAWQRPVHAVLQQTPSTQNPEVHWLVDEQGPPFPAATEQVPAPHV
jgi:hypothetical protein